MQAGVPFIIALPVAGVITGCIGALIAIPALKLHGVYLAIATLALAILADDIIVLLEPWTGGVSGIVPPDIVIFGYVVNRWGNPTEWYYMTLVVTLVVMLVVVLVTVLVVLVLMVVLVVLVVDPLTTL